MALLKTFEQENGVQISYWKITLFTYFKTKNEVEVFLSGYINQDARENNKTPVKVERYKFHLTSNEVQIGDLYNLIKNLPIFENAEDV